MALLGTRSEIRDGMRIDWNVLDHDGRRAQYCAPTFFVR